MAKTKILKEFGIVKPYYYDVNQPNEHYAYFPKRIDYDNKEERIDEILKKHNLTRDRFEIVGNKPINDLEFVKVDYGDSTSVTAYSKKTKLYFTVSGEQFKQAVMKYGILPGGLIGGQWVLGINHTQIKLYLLDGEEYIKLLSNEGFSEHPVKC